MLKSVSNSRVALITLLVGLMASLVIFVGKHGFRSLHLAPHWAAERVKMKLGLEQDASSGMAYDLTRRGPLPLATVVKELHDSWPSGSVTMIHSAALEVGTALLHRGDLEVGEMVGGIFVPSKSAVWDVNDRMIKDLTRSPILFENAEIYVFRRR